MITTDYGNVVLSKKSLKWLESLDPEWFKFKDSKSKTKHANYVRRKVEQFESAVLIAADIAWFHGKVLTKF